jgi:hypothetical protein
MDERRFVMLHVIVFYQRLKTELGLKEAEEAAGAMIDYVTKPERPGAVDAAKRLTTILSARGEADLEHAMALELQGDFHLLEQDHANGALAYEKAMQIRRAARPILERYLGIESESPTINGANDYVQKRDLRRVMKARRCVLGVGQG